MSDADVHDGSGAPDVADGPEGSDAARARDVPEAAAARDVPQAPDARETPAPDVPDVPEGAVADDLDVAPRSARVFVGVLLALLLVPGLIGFDAWPLTAWRLFSASRDAEQTSWVLEAVDGDGSRRVVSLEELPLAYRHAEWPMAELPGASGARRDEVCVALLDAVVDVEPGTVELALARDHARLVERPGGWETEHDVEPFHTCRLPGAGGGG